MITTRGLCVENGEAAALDAVPNLPVTAFREYVVNSVRAGQRVSALFANAPSDARTGPVELYVVLADESDRVPGPGEDPGGG